MPTSTQLGIHDVLQVVTGRFGVEGRERGDEFDLLCPDPAHDERNIGSCSINLRTGLWKCLACGKAGDIISLGALVLGEPYEAVKRSLEPSTPEALSATILAKLGGVLKRPERVRQVKLHEYRVQSGLDELSERGFTDRTLAKWGIRYVVSDVLEGKKQEFTVAKSLAIPIRDADGTLLAWCYRRTEQSPTWQPRYLYTPTVSLSDVWFGLQHHAHSRDITVVEGALDAMWLDQCGIPALALLGSEMGKRKLSMLGQYRRVTLFGDNDAAGALAVQRIGRAVGGVTNVSVVTYPRRIVDMYGGKVDPATLHPLDVELLIEQATPWTTWLSSHAA